jgi:hypothetical protein
MSGREVRLRLALMSGDDDMTRRLRVNIMTSDLPIIAADDAPANEAMTKALDDAGARLPTYQEVNLSIAVALRPVDANLQAAVQWLNDAPIGLKLLVGQTYNPGDDTSQFSSLMTDLQQAIGVHLILCCIVSEDDMLDIIIDKVHQMMAVSGYC